MQAYENRFLRLLAGDINASIRKRMEELVDPKSKAKDHGEYLGRVAAIATLREVIEMMKRAEKELSAPDEDTSLITQGKRSTGRNATALYGS